MEGYEQGRLYVDMRMNSIVDSGYEDVGTSGMTFLVLGNIEYGSKWKSHGVGMRHFFAFLFCLSFIICTCFNRNF